MPTIPPVVDSKLQTLTVKIKDTLEPNTTYYYNFGKAIKDVNESNILEDFSYIFTTGNTLDTMELTGKVLLAETGEIDSTLIVMLHRSADDSAVANEKPRYIAKLDGKGNFRFRYLPTGTFYLYAIKDESGTRRYYSPTQLFAFADSAITIDTDTPPITLFAYAENKKDQQTPQVSFGGGNKGAAGNKADDRRIKYTTNLSAGTQDLLENFIINFVQPLINLDTLKMQLSTDSAFIPVTGSWQLDTTNKKLTLKTTWKESTVYNLILDQAFAEDSLHHQLLKTDTLHFRTRKLEDYGSVRISFKNLDLAKNPVVQFLQGSRVVKSFPLNSAEFYQNLFFPGEYQLSILYDDNKNGKWDPGEFFGVHKQPELVSPLKDKITIRANWENEFEIKL